MRPDCWSKSVRSRCSAFTGVRFRKGMKWWKWNVKKTPTTRISNNLPEVWVGSPEAQRLVELRYR